MKSILRARPALSWLFWYFAVGFFLILFGNLVLLERFSFWDAVSCKFAGVVKLTKILCTPQRSLCILTESSKWPMELTVYYLYVSSRWCKMETFLLKGLMNIFLLLGIIDITFSSTGLNGGSLKLLLGFFYLAGNWLGTCCLHGQIWLAEQLLMNPLVFYAPKIGKMWIAFFSSALLLKLLVLSLCYHRSCFDWFLHYNARAFAFGAWVSSQAAYKLGKAVESKESNPETKKSSI